MDVKYLNYILAIASRKNMTKAAEDLFVSQSSLSQYLSHLEQKLGTPLFTRSKNELSLTPAGELYVETAKRVVQMQKELYQNIATLSHRGRISVGVTSNFGLRMLSEIIPLFKEQFPGVSIEITETSLPGLKAVGGFWYPRGNCCGNLYGTLQRSGTDTEKGTCFLCNPGVSSLRQGTSGRKHHYSPGTYPALFPGQFPAVQKGSSLRILSDQILDSCQFTPSAFCETNSISATRLMIAQNAGVAFIAESCSVDRQHIAYYPLFPDLFRLNLVICQKDWIKNEPERLFLDYILRYFKENTECPYLAENHPVTTEA